MTRFLESEAKRPESGTHFHLFSKLPPEIRWAIWQLVVCTDKTPKIHYYSLFNTDHDGYRQSHLQLMMRAYYEDEPGKIFSGPPNRRRWTRPVLKSFRRTCVWTEANRFLYLWDAALLTACKESRAAWLQHHGKASSRPSASRHPKRSDVVMAHHQGQRVYVKVSSKRDIICFRFAPEDMTASVSMRWDTLLRTLPFFQLPEASDINLALEFDDSWAKGLGGTTTSVARFLQEASPRGVAMRAHWAWKRGFIPRWARMWLIDRGGGLPSNYKASRLADGRYTPDFVYNNFSREPENHHVFTDGKHKYVESYMWEGQTRKFSHMDPEPEVPVLSFIWKMHWRSKPLESREFYNAINLPVDHEYFFRVLRPLPDTDGRNNR